MDVYKPLVSLIITPQVRVFFGDEAYAACRTVAACKAQLAQKGEDDITPFLQVRPPPAAVRIANLTHNPATPIDRQDSHYTLTKTRSSTPGAATRPCGRSPSPSDSGTWPRS